jgi:hypothetical protein
VSQQEPFGQQPYPVQQPYPQQGIYPPQQPQKGPKGQGRKWLSGVIIFVLAIVIAAVIEHVGNSVANSGGGMCTSNSCIVRDLQSNLVGLTAKDDLVTTKAVCQQSTVKDDGNGIYAATCTVTYSDGSNAIGTGTLATQQKQVSFTPTLP